MYVYVDVTFFGKATATDRKKKKATATDQKKNIKYPLIRLEYEWFEKPQTQSSKQEGEAKLQEWTQRIVRTKLIFFILLEHFLNA